MFWLLVVGLFGKLISVSGPVLIGWWLEFFSSGDAPFGLLQALHNLGQLSHILLGFAALYWLPKLVKKMFLEES